jgi:hypothetical protein
VQLSKEIRDDIRDVRIMHSDMADIVRKENHKVRVARFAGPPHFAPLISRALLESQNLKKQGKNDASIKKRQEIVDIVGLHIKEIEQLEKGRGHLVRQYRRSTPHPCARLAPAVLSCSRFVRHPVVSIFGWLIAPVALVHIGPR